MRQDILSLHLSQLKHAVRSQELAEVAGVLHGFVGADIGALVKRGAWCALKRESDCVEKRDLIAALEGVKPSALRELTVEVTFLFAVTMYLE